MGRARGRHQLLEANMTGALKPCKACSAEVEVGALDMFRGVEGPVAVGVNGMPALICANGHKRFLYAEFVAQLMDSAVQAAMTTPPPPAVKRGLLRKHYHCSSCDAELPATATGKSEREVDATFRNAAPFKLVVQVDVHRCPQCGREHVLSNEEAGASAFKAVAHGFHAAGVHVER